MLLFLSLFGEREVAGLFCKDSKAVQLFRNDKGFVKVVSEVSKQAF